MSRKHRIAHRALNIVLVVLFVATAAVAIMPPADGLNIDNLHALELPEGR
jgi:hypothetical protein